MWVPVEEFLPLPDLLSPQAGYASEAGQPFLLQVEARHHYDTTNFVILQSDSVYLQNLIK